MATAPFFIVGSARSGTTLLRLMLNAHSEVAVPPESRFIVELRPQGDVVEIEPFLQRLERHVHFKLWGLPIEAVVAELGDHEKAPYREAIEAVYRAWMNAHGKTRWGDKTPRYVMHIDALAELFPEAKFVHLIRDGRNVALSYADVPFGPKTVGRAADVWTQRVTAGIRAGRRLSDYRYVELRYEDLVADTAEAVQLLCRFLELRYEPEMLDYTDRARDAVLPRAARYNPRLTDKPALGVRMWQKEMPPHHVEIFEAAAAGDLLAELGYERRYARPGVGARLAAVAGRLGLPVGRLSGRRS